MTEITPTYYADGNHRLEFTLKGEGFNSLPNDAVATPMISNDSPLEFRDDQQGYNVMSMTRISDTEVQFIAASAVNHSAKSIGAILSADRSMVYWVNETNPLP